MQPYKILLMTPAIGIGGEELSTLSLAKEMIRRGHDISIYGTRGPLYDEFIHAGATYITCPPYRRSALGVIKDALFMKKVLEREAFDIIHSQSVLPTISSFLCLSFLAKLNRAPKLLFHERGIHEYTYPLVGRLFNYMADLVVANSDYERAKLMRNGLKASHCRRIYNCINIDFPDEKELKGERRSFGFSEDAFVIGTVGRLVKQKGVEFLLKAFQIVLRSHNDVRLLIVGDGILRVPLEKLSCSLGIREKVVFTGWRRDLKHVYPVLDLFVLPSIFEPFGNVPLEAAAFGKPVILTNVGGLPETIIEGKTGLLVPPSDVNALARAISSTVEHKQAAQQLGKLGRSRVEEYFTAPRVGNEIEILYDELSHRR